MTDQVIKLETAGDAPEMANFEGLDVLACVDSEGQAHLQQAFTSISGIECVFSPYITDPVKALTSAPKKPDVFLFGVENGDLATEWLSKIRASGEAAGVQICPIVRHGAKTATVRLLREGADDVLPYAPDDIDLTRCLARSGSNEKSSPTENSVKVLAFLHAPGGVGATTLAVNAALSLAQRVPSTDGGVCLIDFDLQFGDVDVHLDTAVRSRLMDVVEQPERLDHRMLEDLMIDGPAGLRVLTAPERPLPLDLLTATVFQRIIATARKKYQYVVIDMPTALSDWTDTVINNSDKVFLVTEVNVPALRSTRRLIDTLTEESVTLSKLGIVANRYSENRFFGRQITLARAEHALRLPIIGVLPSDFRLMIESVDQGTPAAVSKPSSKYINALNEILDEIVSHKAEKQSRGFFGFGK